MLLHPRAEKPRNYGLSLAVLEGLEEYKIVNGNIEGRPAKMMLKLIDTCNIANDTQTAA